MLDDCLTATGKIVFNDGEEHVVRLVDVKYGENIFKQLLFEEDLDALGKVEMYHLLELFILKLGL